MSGNITMTSLSFYGVLVIVLLYKGYNGNFTAY